MPPVCLSGRFGFLSPLTMLPWLAYLSRLHCLHGNRMPKPCNIAMLLALCCPTAHGPAILRGHRRALDLAVMAGWCLFGLVLGTGPQGLWAQSVLSTGVTNEAGLGVAEPDGDEALVLPSGENGAEPAATPLRSGPATLDAAPRAPSGSELEVRWTGPDNASDYVAIAASGSPGGQQLSYTRTNQGSPLTLRVPDEPGQYELRYIQNQSRTILVSQPLAATE